MTAARIALSAALIASLGLTACGRKTPLDSPYEAKVQAAKDSKTPPRKSRSKTSLSCLIRCSSFAAREQ